MNQSEWNDFAHLTEGEDIFPYDWLIRIKSARERDLNDDWHASFLSNMEERVGGIHDPNPGKYLVSTVGISVAWSNHPPEKADALKTDPEVANDQAGKAPIIRRIGKVPSIRMAGGNCAFCHTGVLQTDGQLHMIQGGQASVSLVRLYSDLVISTLALTINFEGQLTTFLESFAYPHDEAERIAKKFKKSILHDGRLGTKLRLFEKKLNLIKTLPNWAFENEKDNIARHFKKLLRLTYHLKADEDLGKELNERMDFLAYLAQGNPKNSFQDGEIRRFHNTEPGFGRIDAFISAMNETLRKRKDWVDTTAPIGYPPLWGIQSKAVLHYTANTNSVLLRNIGQSMGGGSVLLDDQYDSTVNVLNLSRLEKLMYQIKPPVWEKTFESKGDYVINTVRAEAGRKVFAENCASCHLPQAEKLGPKHNLLSFGLYDLDLIGTDSLLAKNIVKPITTTEDGPVEIPPTYTKETYGIAKTYFKKFGVSETLQKEWMYFDLRGKEWFRNTYTPKNNLGYVSRDLSGYWATAPFLHNNSVPTIWDLLQPAAKRPKIFKIGIMEFDPAKLGLKNSEMDESYICKGNYKWDVNACMDTRTEGNSNSGHEFGTNLPDEAKWQLIEYLKVLGPSYESI